MNPVTLNTGGNGLWSSVRKAVEVVKLSLGYLSDDGTFGELRVYFDTTKWNVNEDGLIYTDSLFLRELKLFLVAQGYNVADVEYSEQGMQGVDYVSLDVGERFLATWHKLNPPA